MLTTLDAIALTLAGIHFGTPLTYYLYLKKKWLPKPWNIKVDPNYRPKITIIIPTYNEARLIKRKLDNIREQKYPREKLEVVVVDSASDDGTPELVKEWVRDHPDIKLILLKESIRRGMVPALNYALKHLSEDNEIVVFTDADAFWVPDALKHVVKYFADSSIGAVTTCIAPLGEDNSHLESTYRGYYNTVRVGESKIHSTPIHNGTLIAFRRKLLETIDSLPTYTGNNDSTPASIIAFMGYRAIQINDTVVREPTREGQVMRKIRRAQHLILHFIHTKHFAKKLGIYRKSAFDKIWRIEAYLYLVNPWLILAAIAQFTASALLGSLLAMLMLLIGALLLFFSKQFRTWVINQVYLAVAMVRCVKTKEIVWSK